jgi:acyl-[acyl-carrier-protein]-phospholipid O-acyltransferase / long-chain-fatty-acid--[acyl-carrier-protein] ligase
MARATDRQRPGDSDTARGDVSGDGLLHLRFLRTARRRWGAFAMADSSGKELTYGRALVGSLALAQRIRSRCPGEPIIGLMLPGSVGGVIANIATLMAGRVPVNLNFTAGSDAIAASIEQCQIRTVLTSTAFLTKAKLEAPPGACFLEDLIAEITPLRRLGILLAASLLPSRAIEWLFVSGTRDPESLATIMFSAGSTGAPKGIMLSHRNLLSNIEAVTHIYPLVDDDRVMGVLPLFHSFGFMSTFWLPLVLGCGAVYHPNPLDAPTIGEMVEKYRATLIISTPSFCLGYVRRCRAEQFASLRYAVVGAEKLREPIASQFREKFGIELMEGYGCTETAPVVAANAPDTPEQLRNKPGTVGRPLYGVSAKIVDRETLEPVAPGKEGLLLIKGPNVMMGYLHAPERTREVLRDGWYVTGDIGSIDADGFIRLTDRVSRFSKIAGEMVPHQRIEEAIAQILGESAASVVTAVPDETRGERLVAFYTDESVPAEVLWARLGESGLPKLWIPRRDHFYRLEAIPLLGAGKIDLKAVQQLALEKTGAC